MSWSQTGAPARRWARSGAVRISSLALAVSLVNIAAAQSGTPYWMTHGGNPQHQQQAPAASQNLSRILWHKPVDLAPVYTGGTTLYIHYGSPLISQSNTVLLPVRKGYASDGVTDVFKLEARNGLTGALQWSMTSDYTLPPHNWVPPFQATLTFDGRLYVPGVGGTILYRAQPDTSGEPVKRYCFYRMTNYNVDRAKFNQSVVINTPLATDNRGNIYFGFRVLGDTNGILRTGGLAKISPGGGGQFIYGDTATGDSDVIGVSSNCAPAVSADGKYVYVAFRRNSGGGYLTAVNTYEMGTKYNRRIFDVLNPGNDALLTGDSTSAPMIGPDGDVYYGILENPYFSHHLRGWMLHFDKTLAVQKPSGSFGWDIMPSFVPASAVPSYNGTSSYLVLTKYNNYAGANGDGVNKLAILDPNDTQVDFISGNTVMKEVLTIACPTPDPEFRDASHPNAVREWCINACAIDPINKCALAGAEDGILYKWDFTTNTLSQQIRLTPGIGEAYTPTAVGPTGVVYAINNATLFAVGNGTP